MAEYVRGWEGVWMMAKGVWVCAVVLVVAGMLGGCSDGATGRVDGPDAGQEAVAAETAGAARDIAQEDGEAAALVAMAGAYAAEADVFAAGEMVTSAYAAHGDAVVYAMLEALYGGGALEGGARADVLAFVKDMADLSDVRVAHVYFADEALDEAGRERMLAEYFGGKQTNLQGFMDATGLSEEDIEARGLMRYFE